MAKKRRRAAARRRLVIDGYNFLMASDEFRPVCLKDKDDARALCAERLEDYARATGSRITIVYDNKTGRPGSRKTIGAIEEIYSRPDETADDVIKTMAARTGKSLLIVTSDREVAGYARHFGAEVIGSGTFADALARETPD